MPDNGTTATLSDQTDSTTAPQADAGAVTTDTSTPTTPFNTDGGSQTDGDGLDRVQKLLDEGKTPDEAAAISKRWGTDDTFRGTTSGEPTGDSATPPAKGTEANPQAKGSTDGEGEPGKDAQAAGDKPDAKALEKARQALKRADFDDDLIATFDDKRLIQMGEKVHNLIAKQQRTHEEARQLREQSDRPASPAGAAPVEDADANTDQVAANTEAPATDDPTQQPDAAAPLIDPVAEVLKDMALDPYYEGLAEPLGKALTGLQTAYQTQLNTVLADQKQELQKERDYNDRLARTLDRFAYRDAQRELTQGADAIPELKDPENFAKAQAKARSLANLPGSGYQDEHGDVDVVATLRDAAGLIFKQTIKSRLEKELTTRHREQVQNVPDDPTSDSKPVAAMSPDEQEAWAIDQVVSGAMTPEQADAHLQAQNRNRNPIG